MAQPSSVLRLPRNQELLAKLPEPKSLFEYFLVWYESETPRVSKSEGGDLGLIKGRIAELAKAWGCTSREDTEGNLVVAKPASAGCENAPGVALQCHLDMVCSAEAEKMKTFNFKTDPIECRIEGDFLKANGTTLGADDGIGVAACMALLADKSLKHGPLECLFTMDEETTMSGAENIAVAPFLTSSIMINIDSEEENAVCIGCAGGFEASIELPTRRAAAGGLTAIDLRIHGLVGGHTGIDIHRGRANAIAILARLLTPSLDLGIRLSAISATGAINTIPRTCQATVLVSPAHEAEFKSRIAAALLVVKADFATVEAGLTLDVNAAAYQHHREHKEGEKHEHHHHAHDQFALSAECTDKLIALMFTAPHGVLKMSPDLANEVETSISLSRLTLKEGSALLEFFCRSSSDRQMKHVHAQLKAFGLLAQAKVSAPYNAFPSWQPNPNSRALAIVKAVSTKVNNREPRIYSVHAGLECGFLIGKYPTMDCVSIGPEIHGAHTPEECLLIPSVSRFYTLLKESLAALAALPKSF